MRRRPGNPFNPSLAEGVRRFGFRKWYERELLSSHAHLLLTILCAVALIGLLEIYRDGTTEERLVNVLLFIVSGIIGLWALRRYLYLLLHAEEVANQANCPGCDAYARFEMIGEDRLQGRILVRCRRCACEWTIDA